MISVPIIRSIQNHFQASCTADDVKKMVGYASVDKYVESGMKVGLGTGSTAYFAVERIGQKMHSGELSNLICVPTSEKTRQHAESLGIPLSTLDDVSKLDITIDGADEVVLSNFALVKGGGGALLREKMVEVASDKFVVVVDESKVVDNIGTAFPVPIEIVPFCSSHTVQLIEHSPTWKRSACHGRLRRNKDNSPYITDNNNFIVDMKCHESIQDLGRAAAELQKIVGVVGKHVFFLCTAVVPYHSLEHGLFLNMATAVMVGNKTKGEIAIYQRK